MLTNIRGWMDEAISMHRDALGLRESKNRLWVASAIKLRTKIREIADGLLILDSENALETASRIESLLHGTGHDTLNHNLQHVLEEAFECMNRKTN